MGLSLLQSGDTSRIDLLSEFPTECNTADGVLFANVQSAVDRGTPLVSLVDAHDHTAVLVGGGPSASDLIEEIRVRHHAGQHIYALNGAAKWLVEHDIVPYAVILLDARYSNIKFVTGLPRGIKFYLASQVHPAYSMRSRVKTSCSGTPIMTANPGL